MHSCLFAYAGPDQIMTVTSGLASILGVVLIFWHKVVAVFNKVVNRFRGTPAPEAAPTQQTPSQNS